MYKYIGETVTSDEFNRPIFEEVYSFKGHIFKKDEDGKIIKADKSDKAFFGKYA